jgi:hypothetical protein
MDLGNVKGMQIVRDGNETQTNTCNAAGAK